jgi:hypothetical protein
MIIEGFAKDPRAFGRVPGAGARGVIIMRLMMRADPVVGKSQPLP